MEKEIKKIVADKTGLSALVVPNGDMSWEVIPNSTKVELTKTEINIAKAKGFDLDKFLLVKQLLMDGKNPSQIMKESGIARSSTLNYKLHYDKDTLLLLQKIQ